MKNLNEILGKPLVFLKGLCRHYGVTSNYKGRPIKTETTSKKPLLLHGVYPLGKFGKSQEFWK